MELPDCAWRRMKIVEGTPKCSADYCRLLAALSLTDGYDLNNNFKGHLAGCDFVQLFLLQQKAHTEAICGLIQRLNEKE